MSVALLVLFVLMILTPCVLALRIRSRGGAEEDGLSLQGSKEIVPAAESLASGEQAVEVVATAAVVPVDAEGVMPEAVAPVLSATTAKVAAAVAAAAKVTAEKVTAEKAMAEVEVRVTEAPPVIRVAPVRTASITVPAPGLTRRAEPVLPTEDLNPDEMTLEQLVDRADFEARVAKAAALRAHAAASDAAARVAAMRAHAAIDAARYARAVATEAAEAARATLASLREIEGAEENEQDLRPNAARRRAA